MCPVSFCLDCVMLAGIQYREPRLERHENNVILSEDGTSTESGRSGFIDRI